MRLGIAVAVLLACLSGLYKGSPYPFTQNDNLTGWLGAANRLGVHRFGDLHAASFASALAISARTASDAP